MGIQQQLSHILDGKIMGINQPLSHIFRRQKVYRDTPEGNSLLSVFKYANCSSQNAPEGNFIVVIN
jgi:hypothetical protein